GIAEETDLAPTIKQIPELENFDSIGEDETNVNKFLNYWAMIHSDVHDNPSR
ncbi:hypothetical protein Bhyg_15864, partial [Pseudolycoriella hygida]